MSGGPAHTRTAGAARRASSAASVSMWHRGQRLRITLQRVRAQPPRRVDVAMADRLGTPCFVPPSRVRHASHGPTPAAICRALDRPRVVAADRGSSCRHPSRSRLQQQRAMIYSNRQPSITAIYGDRLRSAAWQTTNCSPARSRPRLIARSLPGRIQRRTVSGWSFSCRATSSTVCGSAPQRFSALLGAGDQEVNGRPDLARLPRGRGRGVGVPPVAQPASVQTRGRTR